MNGQNETQVDLSIGSTRYIIHNLIPSTSYSNFTLLAENQIGEEQDVRVVEARTLDESKDNYVFQNSFSFQADVNTIFGIRLFQIHHLFPEFNLKGLPLMRLRWDGFYHKILLIITISTMFPIGLEMGQFTMLILREIIQKYLSSDSNPEWTTASRYASILAIP